MFAVPGWAVSADNLRSETASASASASKPIQNESDSKKRKRATSAPTNVTASNVADLWEQVIEGRSGKKARSDTSRAQGSEEHSGDGGKTRSKFTAEGTPKLTLKEKKKLKKLKEAIQNSEIRGNAPNGGVTSALESSGATPGEEGKKDKKKQKKKKSKERKGDDDREAANAANQQHTQVSAPAPPKLTPMQAAMREKLVSARFRHLNETLYTKPSGEALQLFQDSPELFQEYHEGFRRQVDVWPENPVDGYIRDITERGRQKGSSGPKSKQGTGPGPGQQQQQSAVAPLPRTNGVCTIADLGCGDAKLAAALQPERKRLRLEVRSYDLQSGASSPLVTRADIADLPLADGSVDVVIFCLALMGTNWLDFVEEAYRILHWKGELWVAEIKSRFGPVGGGGKARNNKNAPVSHSVGNRRKNAGKAGKGRDAEAGEDDDRDAELAIEVDGAEDKRAETDVSAFVEALRKRGFVLQGAGNAAAVDLSNKMFVKMRFAKAASPSVGKGAVALKEKESGRGDGGHKTHAIKFIDAAEQNTVDESSILKPCVYKLR
ncbi:methyltransferase-domain-containing protein [Xylariaceae sp. FL0662B]|nr:methyltransferase-domain-containing protein [Xylariaceae sp. FL0662B]